MLSAAAWVPDDDPERDWGIAAGLAARWVKERCQAEDAAGILVTDALDHTGVPELDDFGRRHSRTSRRAGRAGRPSGLGPVLSYVPQAEDLEFAMRIARGSSLAVVESVAFPLAGWAAWLGATDLLTGTVTPPLGPSMQEAVESLKFYGNNAFGDVFGKRRARAIVDEFRSEPEFDADLLLGAVLAAGGRPEESRTCGPSSGSSDCGDDDLAPSVAITWDQTRRSGAGRAISSIALTTKRPCPWMTHCDAKSP